MKKNTLSGLLVGLSILSSSMFALAQDKETDNRKELLKQFNYQDNVIYKTVDGKDLELLILLPKTKVFSKTPVMLFTHGGGWSGGDRYVVLKKNFIEPMKTLLDKGIACVSVEYRLSDGNSKVKDAVADCKDAGKYVVKNAAKYGFDTGRMGVFGGSAGGHLSLMTALADDARFQGGAEYRGIQPSYKCVVSYFPQTSFTDAEMLTDYFNAAKLRKMFGEGFSPNSEEGKLLSPTEYIKKGNPPVLIFHGTADSIIAYKNSTFFVEKAKKAGAPAELVTVPKGGHGLGGKDLSPSVSEMSRMASDFMLKYLLGK